MRRRTYKPGDHLVRCDRSGMTFYRSECRREWTGALVAKKFWEPKHPQLEIRSKRDEQAPRDVRPDKSTEFGSTTTSAGSSKYGQSVTLTSTVTILQGGSIGITLDNGDVQWTFATADPSAGVVAINEKLDDDVASGNTVYVASNIDETVIVLSDSDREAAL